MRSRSTAATGPPAGRMAVTAAAIAVMAIGVAGCGPSSNAGSTVDAAKLGRQISAGLSRRLAIPAPPVICPPGRRDAPGVTFSCTAQVDSQTLSITAEVRGAQGNVAWQPSSAVVSTARAEAAIDRQFTAQLQVPVTSTCGPRSLAVVAIGASFTCDATVNGEPRHVVVTARDLTGNVDLVLAPPSTGPAATFPPVTAAPTPGSTPQSPATLPGH